MMRTKVKTKVTGITMFLCIVSGILNTSIAQLVENFSDGDFTANPAWSGETALWQVTGGQLNSNSPNPSTTFYLSTPAPSASGYEWRIYLNLKFATSGANLVDVYLVSDSADLKANGSGYFVRIGGTTDEISLYRKDAGLEIKIIDGTDARSQVNSTDNFIHLKVIRSASDDWTLEDDNTGSGTNFFNEGSINDATYASGVYFGISVTQSTASFFSKHFFDDIYAGPVIQDTTPPSIVSIAAASANQADVLFSEAVEQSSAQTALNYTGNNGLGSPANAVRDGNNPALVHLTFAGLFTSGLTYTLSINGVQDMTGNAVSAAAANFTYLTPVTASPRDVILNEIMADPSPPAGLPAVEFVELYNRSLKTFDLSNWTVTDGSSSGILPFFILSPGQFVILCPVQDTATFSSFGPVAGIAGFPGLNNDGDNLRLLDDQAAIVDEVGYSDAWYGDAVKMDGGWTLELINPEYPFNCSDSLNWSASLSAIGGTPGQQNSIYSTLPDSVGPVFISALATDSLHLLVCFSEGVPQHLSGDTNNYFIDQNIGKPQGAIPLPGDACVELILQQPLTSGLTYSLSQVNLTDCWGNPMTSGIITFAYYETEEADSGDLVINEILFDPRPYGYDFLEIYNRSGKNIDLSSLQVASADILTGTITAYSSITSKKALLLPGEYAVVTESSADIQSRYSVSFPDKLFEVADLPPMNDDEGRILLLNQAQERLDDFYYRDDFHFPLMNDVEGVSLERLSAGRPTNDQSNWHSAAQTAGFGTPTYRNSENSEAGSPGEAFSINPDIFSPDADGYHDVVNILYHFSEPGYVANVTVYDGRGRLVRKLVRNELLGNDGSFSWDGINEDREKAAIGIYVIYIEVFNTSGDVRKYKKTCVLGSKL